MDRYDFETMGGMLAASIAIALNLMFLQADAAFGTQAFHRDRSARIQGD